MKMASSNHHTLSMYIGSSLTFFKKHSANSICRSGSHSFKACTNQGMYGFMPRVFNNLRTLHWLILSFIARRQDDFRGLRFTALANLFFFSRVVAAEGLPIVECRPWILFLQTFLLNK